jgi:hypothetical protein
LFEKIADWKLLVTSLHLVFYNFISLEDADAGVVSILLKYNPLASNEKFKLFTVSDANLLPALS